jgi:hypothetical protein
MNPINTGLVTTTIGQMHATTVQVPGTVGQVTGTIGRRRGEIAAEYHTCLMPYRVEPVSYPVFTPKPSTQRMFDPGTMVPHIRTKNVHR